MQRVELFAAVVAYGAGPEEKSLLCNMNRRPIFFQSDKQLNPRTEQGMDFQDLDK